MSGGAAGQVLPAIISGPDADCSGDPRRMGRLQGSALAGKIQAARLALRELEALRLEQPWWLPFGLFLRLCERRAGLLMEPALAAGARDGAERLLGIAEGAGADPRTLYLLNSLEPFLSFLKGRFIASPAACSAVAVRGSRSATGEPMIARNFDYVPLAQPFYALRKSRPHGRLESLDFTLAPLAGAIDGLNERGLAITYDYAYTLDDGVAAPSISFVISEALERCGTVADAAELIASRPRWGGALLMLADPSGDIASLELSSTRSALRRPAPGEDFLVHTNSFGGAATREVEVPRSAVFTSRAPRALRGKRVHESAEMRRQRMEALVTKLGSLSDEGLAAVMSDHGEEGKPSGLTPCVHSDYWNTTACLQLFPVARRLRASFTYACRPAYRELSL